MKRSSIINLNRMRKQHRTSINKAVFFFGGASVLSGCGDPIIEVKIYEDLNACTTDNPEYTDVCQFNYQEALKIANYAAPRYKYAYDCSREFKYCIEKSNQQNEKWFSPKMAGFIVAVGLEEDYRKYPCPIGTYVAYEECQYPEPVFQGDNLLSEFGAYDSDGTYYYWSSSNKLRKTTPISMDQHILSQPAKKVSKMMSRGGFGSYISQQSSSGGASSKGYSSRSGGSYSRGKSSGRSGSRGG